VAGSAAEPGAVGVAAGWVERRSSGRKSDDHLSAAELALPDRDAAAVRGDELGDDRESEPAAAGVAGVVGSGGVEADESFQDSSAIWLRDAGSVVVDGQDDGAVVGGEAE
jgi:hypothetical protein